MSKNYYSINALNIQQTQTTSHQFTKEAYEDHDSSIGQHNSNLFNKEYNQIDGITYSQQETLSNIENPIFNENDSQIQIFVQIPSGRILSLDVNNNIEYLQQITDLIQKREGIPPNRQKLYLGPQFLNKINSKTIKKNSTLHLKISSSNNIIVIYNNQRHLINVNLNDCVGEIKYQLALNYDYPFDSQELYFKNQQLQNNGKLYQYKIQKHSIVVLKLENLIYIKQASKNRKIMKRLNLNQKIKDLKIQLNQKFNDLGEYHLIYQDQILKDENLVQFYKINHSSIIEIVEIKYIKFSIETQQITLQIKKEQYETIEDIKKEIQSKLQFPIHRQHLFYKGKELENDLKIMNYNIEEDSKLYLFNNLKSLYEITIIDCEDFEDFTIKINPNSKVYELKKKIEDSYQLPINCQCLRYEGKILKDFKDLSYYNIQNFEFIFLESWI